MSFNSTPIADTRVYAQDSEPNDTRDGILWVDTSANPRRTYVYSTDSADWEGVTPALTGQPDIVEVTNVNSSSLYSGSASNTVANDGASSSARLDAGQWIEYEPVNHSEVKKVHTFAYTNVYTVHIEPIGGGTPYASITSNRVVTDLGEWVTGFRISADSGNSGTFELNEVTDMVNDAERIHDAHRHRI